IALKGQISSFTAAQSMDLCFAGSTVACSAFLTNPPNGDLRSTSTQITHAIATAFNLASTITDGFDVEASYTFDLEDWGIPGNFRLRSLATHVSSFKSDSGILNTIPTQQAGVNGGSIPLWKVLGVQTYTNDKWSFSLTEQYISDGVLNKQFIQ